MKERKRERWRSEVSVMTETRNHVTLGVFGGPIGGTPSYRTVEAIMLPRLFSGAASAHRKPVLRPIFGKPLICASYKAPGRERQFSFTKTSEPSSAKPFYVTTPIFYVNAGITNNF